MVISEHTSQSNVYSPPVLFMFQGPAGAKGDKGERVSHSTRSLQPLFREYEVLLCHLAVEMLIFC